MKIEHKGKKYELDIEKAVEDGYLKEEYPEPRVGEYYKFVGNNNYLNGCITIVACIGTGYCLIPVVGGFSNGNRWIDPVKNINDIFSCNRENFIKIENPFE